IVARRSALYPLADMRTRRPIVRYEPHPRRRSLNSSAILLADHAAPCRQALGRMLPHPLGELRRAHQAGLHRDVGEVRGGNNLLVANRGRREVAEHSNDLDHDRTTPSLRLALALVTCPRGAVSCLVLTGSIDGKMLSYIVRASRMRRALSRSDFGTNRTIS